MSLGVVERLDLLARIDRWNQEVIKNTLQQRSTRQSSSQSYKHHHMKRRSQVTRPALGEISGNSYSRKRKASSGMADRVNTKASKKAVTDRNAEEDGRRLDVGPRDEALEQPGPRRRGRPPKNPQITNAPEIDLQLRPEIPPTPWPPSGSGSPRKGTTSPSKRGQIALNKPIAEAAIDMNFLRYCDPAVHQTTFSDLRVDMIKILPQVEDLFLKLESVPQGLIPSALKVGTSPSDC